MKSAHIRSFFWSVFSRIHTGVSLRIQSKCGKIRTRKNSVLGHFSCSELCRKLNIFDCNLNATMSTTNELQKQPSKDVLRKRYSENMQQIFKKTPMLKCDLNKDAKASLLKSHLIWLLTCKFAAYFQNTFS